MRGCFTARIEWITYEQGGRKTIPPQGARYCPLVQISGKEQSVWSIDFICPDFNMTNVITFNFVKGAH